VDFTVAVEAQENALVEFLPKASTAPVMASREAKALRAFIDVMETK
jgi:hypothetical protein